MTPGHLPLSSEDLARVSGHARLWRMLEHLLRLARAVTATGLAWAVFGRVCPGSAGAAGPSDLYLL